MPKITPKFLPLLAVLTIACTPVARADADTDAARRADDVRVAATISGDPAGLAAIFSDDLTYVHSTGTVNHKADFIQTLSSHSLRYVSLDYEVRQFQAVGPGIVLMRGRCKVHSDNHGKDEHIRLSFLAVYRRESGVWRFLAWQSCKLTDSSPPWPN